MAFQFCVLGSGSSGNSVAFWDSETLFLVDAGFTCKAASEKRVLISRTSEQFSYRMNMWTMSAEPG